MYSLAHHEQINNMENKKNIAEFSLDKMGKLTERYIEAEIYNRT